MLARIRKSQEERDGGFTLIELLVVMIIIGILAAIAIPVFLNQRKKARESSAKADVSVIGKEVAAYYVDGNTAMKMAGTAPNWTLNTDTTTPVAVTSGKLSPNNVLGAYKINSGTDYCVAVGTSDSPAVYWKFTQGGLVSGNC